jgi:hypothetical protein
MINTVVQLLQQYFFTWHLELTGVRRAAFREAAPGHEQKHLHGKNSKTY